MRYVKFTDSALASIIMMNIHELLIILDNQEDVAIAYRKEDKYSKKFKKEKSSGH